MSPDEELNPERWLDEYGDTLFRYAMSRLGSADHAEDAVQETLVAAWTGRERYAGKASERNWLMGILKNKIVDQLRHRYRERPVSDLAEEQEGEDSLDAFFDRMSHWKSKPSAWEDPRSALEESEFFEVFERCVKALPDRWREVFRVRLLQERSYEESCGILGVTATNLGVLIHRARLRMRECLEINWFRPEKAMGKKQRKAKA